MIMIKPKPKENKRIGKYLILLFGKNSKYGFSPEVKIRESLVGVLKQETFNNLRDARSIYERINNEKDVLSFVNQKKNDG